jgi:hypothetical protein
MPELKIDLSKLSEREQRTVVALFAKGATIEQVAIDERVTEKCIYNRRRDAEIKLGGRFSRRTRRGRPTARPMLRDVFTDRAA